MSKVEYILTLAQGNKILDIDRFLWGHSPVHPVCFVDLEKDMFSTRVVIETSDPGITKETIVCSLKKRIFCPHAYGTIGYDIPLPAVTGCSLSR